MDEVQFISVEEVIKTHERMLRVGGGADGMLNFELLHSAVERPKASFYGDYLYPTIFDMAASLLQSLAGNHPFVDANKRTAYFSTIRFLEKNGLVFDIQREEISKFMLQVVVDKISLADIASWFRDHQIA